LRATAARASHAPIIGLAILLTLNFAGCRPPSDGNRIRITGSDTMVNLSQSWAEAYCAEHAEVSPQIRGGGSGVGLAALCNGKVEIATSSRKMKPKELELAKKNTGKEPKEFIVGRDALAIYIHKDNPLAMISIPDLAEIYGENGKITRWEQVGDLNAPHATGEIVRISRQNNSGTFAYFGEAVLGKGREYKQGAIAQSGSADVVSLVSKTPSAIGYSGMGYFEVGQVKMIPVSKKKGEPGIEPTLATTLDGTYPISRPLYIYTLGEPTGPLAEFIQWVLGPQGQKIVEARGYVPNAIPAEKAAAAAVKAPDVKASEVAPSTTESSTPAVAP